MWAKLSKKEKENYYRNWIKGIVKDETKLSLSRHIVRHAKEIYEKDPNEWSASMKNLLEVFDKMHKVDTPIELCLKKLENKYKSRPKRYTSPPKGRI